MFERRRKIGSLYVVLLFSILLFLVNRYLFSFLPTVHTAASVISYPVLLAQNKIVVPIQRFVARRRRSKELETIYQLLQKENHELRAHNTQLRALLQHQKDIQELVEFKKRYGMKDAVTAQIVFRHAGCARRFFFIDKGARHGIEPDMIAVYQNSLIGRVSEVHPLYSMVVAVTDASCKVAVYCAQTGASGIHVGTKSEKTTALKRVSHLLSVCEGDLVMSSGEGLVFPRGFGLGMITSVQPGGLHYNITVEPLVDLKAIQHCVVMKKGQASANKSFGKDSV